MGSTFGPELVEWLKNKDYATFLDIVTKGQTRAMPALRDNKNVMCFIEDIYAYLRARSQGAVNEFRPNTRTRDPKPEQAKVYEKECFP